MQTSLNNSIQPDMRHMSVMAGLLMTILVAFGASAQSFVDYGPAPRFLELEIHGIAGNSRITENYVGCFPMISQMNTSPGTSLGVGVAAVFGLRNWLGLGTEANILRGNYRMDLAVSAEDGSSMSNIFLRNGMTYLEIPLYLQFRFNIARNVRWRVNGGVYYAYGLAGHQSQDIYNAQVNQLGQLVSTSISIKPSYFCNGSTFINAFRRSDIGIHLATSLLFGRVSIGGRLGIGLKNIAYIPGGRGIVTPNIHNINYTLTVGYRL